MAERAGRERTVDILTQVAATAALLAGFSWLLSERIGDVETCMVRSDAELRTSIEHRLDLHTDRLHLLELHIQHQLDQMTSNMAHHLQRHDELMEIPKRPLRDAGEALKEKLR